MNRPDDWELEERLRKALGSPGKADFEGWRKRHGDAVAYLNPVVTELYQRRRRIVMRVVSGTIAAMFFLAVLSWTLVPERTSFAQAVKAINKAQTITWTKTTYERFYSRDGKRTWLRTRRSTYAYKQPGLYRQTRYDDDGNVSLVTIIDSKSGEFLVLDMKAKKTGSQPSFQAEHHPDGAFGWVTDLLKTKPLEFVGQRKVKNRTVNVVRYHHENMRIKKKRSRDIWIDAESKQLVGYSDPGADTFDPSTMADRDTPAEKFFSKGTMLGGIVDDIVYNAKVDADLFSLSPPVGFEIVEYSARPTITEAEMVEFLGVTVGVNNDTFFHTARGFDNERFNEAYGKDKADRTDAEQKLIDLYYSHRSNGNRDPVLDFATDKTVSGTFRYLGKGVKLGSADRVVCWYKLKSTGRYRAVFGDLTVRDVTQKDLPLPIDQ